MRVRVKCTRTADGTTMKVVLDGEFLDDFKYLVLYVAVDKDIDVEV